jgi:hypothetical protein
MKQYYFIMFFLFFASRLFAQDGMYLIPQTMYVGDRGTLVLPLGLAYAEIEAIVITEEHLLPTAADIVISRIEVDKRIGVPRLLVEFQAYAPGLLELPSLNLGGYEFIGLKVQITSILESEGDSVLSDAAPPLPVPGTLSLIYGSIIALILFLICSILFGFRGIPYMKMLSNYRHRRFMFHSLKRSINKMRSSIEKNGVFDNELLTKAAQDFRKFLSFFTKINCFTMVSKEFLSLPKMMYHQMMPHQMMPHTLKGGEVYIFEHGEILYRIFKRCDDLRFSGSVYKKESVLQFLDSISRFAEAFDSCEKEKPVQENAHSLAPEAAS